MPYFSDSKEDPKIFQGKNSKLAATNQKLYHQNYWQSHLEKQMETANNIALLLEQLEHKMDSATKETNLRINHQETAALELLSSAKEHRLATEAIHSELLSVQTLIQKNSDTLDKEELINNTILEQIAFQEQAITSLSSQIKDYSEVNMEVKEKVDKTEELYSQVAEKLDLQEVFHQTLIEKMEKQEAYFSKITHQLDMLKSIIFERVHVITEHIETNMNKLTKPIQHFFLQKEKKDID
ncbi:hypothetical protein [Niallia sp. NCCP-28]|uniref:hypothetical protein n=1 Tax=Niallia sp. NCCP-28 TaxID=2934712 RepID=UPI00208BC5EF|nr:hypothetical protein [Niallia sp. NCCP-28]GKU82862.1 hypothetical protein NCCP28_22580 [Niallia sp. NCCP-28]